VLSGIVEGGVQNNVRRQKGRQIAKRGKEKSVKRGTDKAMPKVTGAYETQGESPGKITRPVSGKSKMEGGKGGTPIEGLETSY